MPILEFHCPACKRDVEVLLLARDERAVCPECGSDTLTRLISAPATRPRIPGAIKHARRLAAAEGHFSHYGAKEKSKT